MKIKRNHKVIALFAHLPNKMMIGSAFFKKKAQNKLNKMLTNSMETFNYPLFKLSLMLGANPNIDAQIKKDYHLVTRCARSGEALFLKTLLDFGGNVHSNLEKGDYFPLHMAATKGMSDTIEVLIQYGADINAVYELEKITPREGFPLGWTALVCACMQNKTEAAKTLIDLGANPFDTNEKGISVVDICLRNNNQSLANYLLEKQKKHKQ